LIALIASTSWSLNAITVSRQGISPNRRVSERKASDSPSASTSSWTSGTITRGARRCCSSTPVPVTTAQMNALTIR
jgi:hypothetical protein